MRYATGGLGGMVDRAIFDYKDRDGDTMGEKFAFVWSAGGGIEAMATRWLSFGVGLRLGLAHGDRASTDVPTDSESGHFPFAQLWGTATFHL